MTRELIHKGFVCYRVIFDPAQSIPWKPQANALESGDAAPRFGVTHPFHPLCGQTLELAAHAREWGEERVYYRDPSGRMRFLPARWTSIAVPDPFVVMSADRAYFRLENLIRLPDRLMQLREGEHPSRQSV